MIFWALLVKLIDILVKHWINNRIKQLTMASHIFSTQCHYQLNIIMQLTYTNWGAYQPQTENSGQDCVYLRYTNQAGDWTDDHCDTTRGFICKKPKGTWKNKQTNNQTNNQTNKQTNKREQNQTEKQNKKKTKQQQQYPNRFSDLTFKD